METGNGTAQEWRPGIEESRWGVALAVLWIVFMGWPAGVQLGLADGWFLSGCLFLATLAPLGLVTAAGVWVWQSCRARVLGVTTRRLVAVNRRLQLGRLPGDPAEMKVALHLHARHRGALLHRGASPRTPRWLSLPFAVLAGLSAVSGSWWQVGQMTALALMIGLYLPRASRRQRARIALMDRKLGAWRWDDTPRTGQ